MRVLMTGAAGGIGTMIRHQLRSIYPDLVLSDQRTPADLKPEEKFVAADLSDMAQLEAALDGVDAVAHFGGFSVEGPWETILGANIVGCYNLFEAARRTGVKRVVFASSNHAVGFYPRHQPIPPAVVPRPDTRYGVSKVFGEALGALYADKHGLRVLSIRIGNVTPQPVDRRRLAIWQHPEDLVALLRIGFEHPDLTYEVVYGASFNERSWWDNSRAYELGYRPRHRAEDYAASALSADAKYTPDPVGDYYQGGPFCTDEFSATPPAPVRPT
ncbi:MAG: NAD(P)-dependent oxidoreductase [Hyphomicrobiaceae bacterium]|nr:NAD(P)-dependent oxidoreductase [Hyphomicrobiaceae bacterium]